MFRYTSGSGGKMVRKLLKLFITMLYISAFTFGGGFVIVTFMKRKFVEEQGILSEQEMLDIIAMAQSCPGAIAVNAAILVGWKHAGFYGMLAAVLGTVIPPVAILSVISLFYKAFAANRYVALLLKGMQAGVAAVILDVTVSLGLKVLKKRSWIHTGLMILAFLLAFFLKVNVVLIMICAAFTGVLITLMAKKGGLV